MMQALQRQEIDVIRGQAHKQTAAVIEQRERDAEQRKAAASARLKYPNAGRPGIAAINDSIAEIRAALADTAGMRLLFDKLASDVAWLENSRDKWRELAITNGQIARSAVNHIAVLVELVRGDDKSQTVTGARAFIKENSL